MSNSDESRFLLMPIDKASQFATECWRLGRLKSAPGILGADRLALDRTARCLNDILNSIGLQIIDFIGTVYDPGIVPEVIEVQIDSTLPEGTSRIDETVLPTVMWNGKIIQIGRIVVRQASVKAEITGEKA